jgi:hypothetical protein
MSFYVYRAIERVFLAAGEPSDSTWWTASFFDAAAFPSREVADEAAVRELGEGHDAYVLDDGIEA